jgi:BirA family biotin operon repressor/biotin-[acetyl-CoA-carboxylase] ligase
MDSIRPQLRLPSLYELVELQSVDSVIKEARRRAEAGADEGTLIWAHEQTDAYERSGNPWHSPPKNLYCAVILQPESPFIQALPINYVAAVSLGTALGSLMSPMVTLRYRWPNDITLNGDKAAGIFIDTPTPTDAQIPWMVVGIAVNIATYPDNPNPGAVSVHEVEGNKDINVTDVLEEYSKQFLHWINRWAEHGFESILKTWQQRVDGVDEEISIELRNETVTGIFKRVETNGDIAVQIFDNRVRNVSLREFYALP